MGASVLHTIYVSTSMYGDKIHGCKAEYFPPRWPSCGHPISIPGCHRCLIQPTLANIFRCRSSFQIPSWPRACRAYSYAAITISTDGFSMLASISFPNYTVERSAVANNQINEFGRLGSIIASSPHSARCTIILYSDIREYS